MASFCSRMRQAARSARALVLACDLGAPPSRLPELAASRIGELAGLACAVKLNMHLILPLSHSEIRSITAAAHRHRMQAIADIKLNDISSTNEAAMRRLWAMGFDAVIANPVMGARALAAAVRSAHAASRGVIALCHMSAPEARATYEARLGPASRPRALYEAFLSSAVAAGADGLVVGATYPDIIRKCARRARRTPIYSPGVGAQGGSARAAADAGATYLIAGRSVIGARSPRAAASDLLGHAGL